MSKSKKNISPNILNDNKSSYEIINEYRGKYKNLDNKISKKPKSQILFNNINHSNKSKINKLISKINNEITKSSLDNKFLIKASKRPINKKINNLDQNKNKIYTLNDTNKNNNILLETEKETINDPKPDPLPVKINKNNKIDYNSLIKNNFTKKNNNENLIVSNIKKEIKNKNKDFKLIFVLKNLDLENLINCFNYHYVKFSDLFRLNRQDFLEMNIPIGPRNRIINFINEYSKYAKNYDLNELKEFFNNKIKNGIIVNDTQYDNNYKCIISYDENKENENKNKSYYKNFSNISIFNNYYGNKIPKEKCKNKNKIKNNKSSHNNNNKKERKYNEKKKEERKSNDLFNKYNSMSTMLNNNILYRNEKNKMKGKSFESLLTFNGEKKTGKNDMYILPLSNKEEINKKSFDKSNSMKIKKSKNLNESKEKRKKFVDNFSNINEEVKIFENHLKEIRKKSLETNSKIENLLSKRRNSAFFVNPKYNVIKNECEIFNSHLFSNNQKKYF